VACSQVGVREHPPGSNRGPEVEKYLAAVGCNPGDPWCMAFVYWCYRQAAAKIGKENPLTPSGSCSAIYRWAKREGKLASRPTPGDVFLVKGGKTGHCHTGIVVGVDGGFVQTVEGNTNPAHSAEGIGVFRLTRKARTLDFVHL
ncbi:MAG: CHAP domain-containing protein, partial [Chloroflexota bacterium]